MTGSSTMSNIEHRDREWVVKSVGGRADAKRGFEVTFGPFADAAEANDAKHQLAGAVAALREAIEAARLFNRSGMTWLEYDALLARLEHDHLGGQ